MRQNRSSDDFVVRFLAKQDGYLKPLSQLAPIVKGALDNHLVLLQQFGLILGKVLSALSPLRLNVLRPNLYQMKVQGNIFKFLPIRLCQVAPSWCNFVQQSVNVCQTVSPTVHFSFFLLATFRQFLELLFQRNC